jgi:hypothetical protein
MDRRFWHDHRKSKRYDFTGRDTFGQWEKNWKAGEAKFLGEPASDIHSGFAMRGFDPTPDEIFAQTYIIPNTGTYHEDKESMFQQRLQRANQIAATIADSYPECRNEIYGAVTNYAAKRHYGEDDPMTVMMPVAMVVSCIDKAWAGHGGKTWQQAADDKFGTDSESEFIEEIYDDSDFRQERI